MAVRRRRSLALGPEAVPAHGAHGRAVEAAERALEAALAEVRPGAGEVRDQIELEDRACRIRQ